MNNDILSSFLNNGFIEKSKSCIEKVLFDDFKVIVKSDDDWAEDEFVTLYIYADRFFPFIKSIFESPIEAEAIQPRKLTNDRSGCLGMASSTIEKVDGEWKIWLNGEETSLQGVLDVFSEAQNLHKFYDLVYIKVNRYFIWVETIWVYLFLNKLLGVTSASGLNNDINREEMRAIVRSWGMNSKPSEAALAKVLAVKSNMH